MDSTYYNGDVLAERPASKELFYISRSIEKMVLITLYYHPLIVQDKTALGKVPVSGAAFESDNKLGTPFGLHIELSSNPYKKNKLNYWFCMDTESEYNSWVEGLKKAGLKDLGIETKEKVDRIVIIV